MAGYMGVKLMFDISIPAFDSLQYIVINEKYKHIDYREIIINELWKLVDHIEIVISGDSTFNDLEDLTFNDLGGYDLTFNDLGNSTFNDLEDLTFNDLGGYDLTFNDLDKTWKEVPL